MIERYSRKELKRIWEDQNRYNIWLQIELAAAAAMEKFKIIPKGVVKKVKSKSKINVKRILKIEEKVRHDLIAFLNSVTEKTGKEGSFLHKGLTSSDVLDTCFNLQLRQSGLILSSDIEELLKFHHSHGKAITITGVHPPARFGELIEDNSQLVSFTEKPQTSVGLIKLLSITI